jgi:hypothetical protein
VSNPDPSQPVYRVVLRALPDRVPAIVRLRGVLKALLRSYGFVCTEAVEVKPEGGAGPTGAVGSTS